MAYAVSYKQDSKILLYTNFSPSIVYELIVMQIVKTHWLEEGYLLSISYVKVAINNYVNAEVERPIERSRNT